MAQTFTFSQYKTALDAIAARIVADRALLLQGKSINQGAANDLTSLGTEYSAMAQQLTTDAAANPSDAALATYKAELDRMTTEFNALKTVANNTVTAAAV